MVSYNIIKSSLLLISSFSLFIDSTYSLKSFKKCIRSGDIALTFDDGPSLLYTSKILDILDKEKVKATFFVNGNNTCYLKNNAAARKLIKREYNSGHVVASHTYSHPMNGITGLSNSQLTYEINTLNDIIYNIIGVKPAFFRPPLGEISKQNEKVLEKCGITANILWNLDSEDWNVNYNATQQYIKALKNVKSSLNSFIALNHDIHKVTASKNLETVIKYIKSRGYRFVTMDVCTGMKAYQGYQTTKTNNSNNNDNTNANNNINSNSSNTIYTNTNASENSNSNTNSNTNINTNSNLSTIFINTETNTNNNTYTTNNLIQDSNNNLANNNNNRINTLPNGRMEIPNPNPLKNNTLHYNIIVASNTLKSRIITLWTSLFFSCIIFVFIL
ncbi:glycoside hydrolase/deacetylase [Neocallimastix sp. 'constans']|jgi:peptidoglycan/xylan/chitin deacetylase (PgdA/CDA1 family)